MALRSGLFVIGHKGTMLHRRILPSIRAPLVGQFCIYLSLHESMTGCTFVSLTPHISSNIAQM